MTSNRGTDQCTTKPTVETRFPGGVNCKVLPDVWNQIRIAAEDARIRVWFDRMHPSADKDRGLRIDFTDPNPILAGAVGLPTHRVPQNRRDFR